MEDAPLSYHRVSPYRVYLGLKEDEILLTTMEDMAKPQVKL